MGFFATQMSCINLVGVILSKNAFIDPVVLIFYFILMKIESNTIF